MRSMYKLTAVLLSCLLLLSLACCGASPATELAPPAATRLLAETRAPAPDPSLAPDSEIAVPSNNASLPSNEGFLSGGDVPATIPDEKTTLTYTVGEEEVTASAVLHHALLGYSIVYDAEHYVCNSFTEGDSYWAGEGIYLAVNLVFGLPVDDVIAGLRLQENIPMEPELVAVGAGEYISYTLYFTNEAGLYRQFWIMDCGGDVLLVEQSYDTVSDDSALYRASQLAMLETLTILY